MVYIGWKLPPFLTQPSISTRSRPDFPPSRLPKRSTGMPWPGNHKSVNSDFWKFSNFQNFKIFKNENRLREHHLDY